VAEGLTIRFGGPDTKGFQVAISQHLGALPREWMPVAWYWLVEYFSKAVFPRQFDQEGAFLNDAQWSEINAKYRSWKVAKYGPQADWIGRRTTDMRSVFTNILGSEGGIYSVTDGGMGVEFGGETASGDADYAQYFDKERPIFGDPSTWPPEMEFEMGKLLTMVYMQLFRLRGVSGKEGVRPDGWPDKTALDGFRSGPIDEYIDRMMGEIG